MDNKETIILTTIDLINKKGEQIFVKKAWGNYATTLLHNYPNPFSSKIKFPAICHFDCFYLFLKPSF